MQLSLQSPTRLTSGAPFRAMWALIRPLRGIILSLGRHVSLGRGRTAGRRRRVGDGREPLRASRRCPHLHLVEHVGAFLVRPQTKRNGTLPLSLRGAKRRGNLPEGNTNASERYASNTRPRLYAMRRSEGEPPYRRLRRQIKKKPLRSVIRTPKRFFCDCLFKYYIPKNFIISDDISVRSESFISSYLERFGYLTAFVVASMLAFILTLTDFVFPPLSVLKP